MAALNRSGNRLQHGKQIHCLLLIVILTDHHGTNRLEPGDHSSLSMAIAREFCSVHLHYINICNIKRTFIKLL